MHGPSDTSPASAERVLILGLTGGTQLGGSFLNACHDLGIPGRFVDYASAFKGPRILRTLCWRCLGHRPLRLNEFNDEVCRAVSDFRPTVVLSAGLIQLTPRSLETVRRVGAVVAFFSSDDPWSPGHRSRRFQASLPLYDHIFSPRHATADDFRRAGAKGVTYLPFGYDPRAVMPSETVPPSGPLDLLFVGGADRDRIAMLRPVVESGLSVRLCGGYWNRDPVTRTAWAGSVAAEVAAELTKRAKINLCLVRRSNRDGHVMRSFEAAAVGACILAEDTPDHRAIYGDTAEYFADPAHIVEKTRALILDEPRRLKLAARCRARILGGHHTYTDRLKQILAVVRGT